MFEQLSDAGAPRGGRHLVDAAIKIEIVLRAYALLEPSKFEQGPAASANLFRTLAYIEAHYPGLTLCGLNQSEQEVNSSRFPCAVRSKKAEYNAGRHFERKIIDRSDLPKGAGKMFRTYDRVRHIVKRAVYGGHVKRLGTVPLSVLAGVR